MVILMLRPKAITHAVPNQSNNWRATVSGVRRSEGVEGTSWGGVDMKVLDPYSPGTPAVEVVLSSGGISCIHCY